MHNKASQCRKQAGWIRKLTPDGRRYTSELPKISRHSV